MSNFEDCRLTHLGGTRWVLLDPQGREVARLIIDIQLPLSGSLAGSGTHSA